MKDQSGKDMVSKSKEKILTFQDTILNLQKFWSKKGCIVLQPYDMEVGAGTFHPATTLRSLGAKPWKTAYEISACLVGSEMCIRDSTCSDNNRNSITYTLSLIHI